ncbi:MAG TPA: DUF2461 domain-containing protein [Bryobacteraceae bacterium]|jgi:uncharacterized protein (TIGR02453 family)|nr:DUF2461 domain-containing protein [Bryobacteraceae bacterium]
MPRAVFKGFPEHTQAFLKSLERNNRREWFQPRKPVFEEQVKRPMLELVAALNNDMARFAPLHVTEPENAIYRIYRDTRFSKDKKPYKTHIAAYFPRRGLDRHTASGYYVGISHKEVAVGGGLYMPAPEILLAVRNRIAENHTELRRILKSKTLLKAYGELQGEKLSRAPKGFAADHPAADLLRYKQLFYYIELPPDLATSRTVYGEIRKRFEALTPLIDFLNASMHETRSRKSPRVLL